LRKSGAAGSHGDKTKTIPRKEKYKKISMEDQFQQYMEADPDTLGKMNDKMRDVLSKVDTDDKAQAQAAKDKAEADRQAKAKELGDEGMKKYIDMLKSHDWTYQYSDDHSVWQRGSAEADEIRRLGDIVDPDRKLYKQHSPFYEAIANEYTLEDERYDSNSSGKFQITFGHEDMDNETDAHYLQVLKNLLKTYKGVDIAKVDDVESYIMIRGLPEQNKEDIANERSLTKGEEKDKEKYVKGMKKNKKDFKKRYGDDAEAVMYATATKMAKESSDIFKALQQVEETATAGATSAGNIATVASPHMAIGDKKTRKKYGLTGGLPNPPKAKAQKPTDNALDMKGTSIFGGPLKRS